MSARGTAAVCGSASAPRGRGEGRTRLKVVDVDAPRDKLRLDVRRHELPIEIRADRELCRGRGWVSFSPLRDFRNANAPSRVKLKRGGRSLPVGIFASGILRSSKKGCVIAAREQKSASVVRGPGALG